MTKAEKRKFIRDFMGSIQKEMLAKVNQMPEEWNGVELRYFIGEKFKWEMEGPVKRLMTRRRKADYRAEVYNRNL